MTSSQENYWTKSLTLAITWVIYFNDDLQVPGRRFNEVKAATDQEFSSKKFLFTEKWKSTKKTSEMI